MQREGLLAAIGALADRLEDLVGVKRLPWWSRFVIAILIDFIDFWAALLMAFVPGMHLFFDAWLLLASTMLWGSSGLLQIIEVVPGLHTFFDFLPMVTLSGIVDYWREGGETSAQTNDQRDSLVAKGVFMGFLAGFIAGFLGKVAGLLSVMDMVTATIAVGCLVALFSFFGRDRGWWRWYTGAAVLFGIGFLYFALWALQESGKFPENFRKVAWEELVEEGDFRIKAAQKADEAGELLGAEGIVEGTKEKVGDTYGALKGFLRERYKGSEEGLVGSWLKEKKPLTTPPAASGTPAPAPEQKKKQKEEEIPIPAGLGTLGAMEAKVYRSDYVLERAKEEKGESVEDMKEWAFLFFLPTLASLVLLALGVTSGESGGGGRSRSTMPASSGSGHGAVFGRGGGNGTI